MRLYLVENEDAPINNWGSYWIVKANTKREAIDKAYRNGNEFIALRNSRRTAKESGILKRKLIATCIDELLATEDAYMVE